MQGTGDDTGDQVQNVQYCDAIGNDIMCTLMTDISISVSIFGSLYSSPVVDPSRKHPRLHQIYGSISVLRGTPVR